jgi:stage II sporulation protein D
LRPANGLIIFLIIILLVLTPIILLKKHESPYQNPLSTIPITLLAKTEGKIYHTDLENYLIGVVAAEMPANFGLEALKAQAVAARTIAIGRLKRFGGRGCQYLGVDFTDNPSENQAWQSNTALIAKWGTPDFRACYSKVSRAVQETAGIIMTYNKKPIDAVFHSTCGVGTADAMEVWQHQIPYLKSVDCGFDHDSPHYYNQIAFSWNDLAACLHIPVRSLKIIRVRSRSNRGRVLFISVGKYLLTGEDFRRALTLTSTVFTWTLTKNGIIFKTVGYGHGVGMCQYGADGMAKQGYTYQQILCHYYQGIQFCKIKE